MLSEADQRMWATLGHAGGILIGFLAGLIVYLAQKGKGQFVEESAKEALNFQITIAIAGVAFGILGAILTIIGIGFFIIWLPWLAQLVFGIMAAVATNQGTMYRYPVTIRLIK